jgi:hypothetical protein
MYSTVLIRPPFSDTARVHHVLEHFARGIQPKQHGIRLPEYQGYLAMYILYVLASSLPR